MNRLWRTDKAVCSQCSRKLEATAEYFYRTSDGRLSAKCKDCVKARMAAAHTTEKSRNRHRLIQSDPLLRAKKRASNKASYEKNKQKRLADMAEYRARPDVKEKRKAFDASRFTSCEAAEAQKQYLREYNIRRRKDPIVLETMRATSREWAKRKPEKAKANVRNRRARQREAEGTHTAEDIAAILSVQHHLCFWCDGDIGGGKHTVDHLVPLARGGSNWPDNIVGACASCNYSKGAMMPDEFRAYRAMKMSVAAE